MRKTWRKFFGTAALAFMLCLTGLVMSGEAQAQRFVDNWDGTVTDMFTKLMWTKDANPIGLRNWHDAMSECSSFSINGIGGWRLPNKDELAVIFDAIQDEHPFTRVTGGPTESLYWSSTTSAHLTDFAWFGGIMHRPVVSTALKDSPTACSASAPVSEVMRSHGSCPEFLVAGASSSPRSTPHVLRAGRLCV